LKNLRKSIKSALSACKKSNQTSNNKMEPIQNFLQAHYQTALPVMGILTGLLLLIAAKKEASWLFGEVSPTTCNLKKLDGWINLFGKRAAKRMMYASAVFVIAASVLALVIKNNE
jgi:flagellar biosynthesis protein FlhB